jgi:SAM-dependent methyltransferase
MKPNNWFENWFDTLYYHLLYHKRDEGEAAKFIDALVNYLKPNKEAHFLDLACGKGRHSIYLNKKGFQVTGLDLSHNSIKEAKKNQSDTLKFMEHDMRHPLGHLKFDFILNLFTSFGYFETLEDDVKVIKNVKKSLFPDGIFVLDYFNIKKNELVIEGNYTKIVDDIKFDIDKKIVDDKIIKKINVSHQGQIHSFVEQVRIYNLPQFKQILSNEGLTLMHAFGNYKLEPFNETNSERLILIAKNEE